MLDPKTIAAITRQVQTNFPEVIGCQPRVRKQAVPKTAQPQGNVLARYLITFQQNANLPTGEKLVCSIRVIADARGKILKVTTSR